MWESSVPFPKFDGTQNCKGYDLDDFYFEGKNKTETWRHNVTAKKICDDCPFLNECLLWGVYEEQHGIWGGTTARDREIIRKKLKLKIDWRLKRVDFDRQTKEQ